MPPAQNLKNGGAMGPQIQKWAKAPDPNSKSDFLKKRKCNALRFVLKNRKIQQ
jgi:hypothetical protein